MSAKDKCDRRLEAATISAILHLFGQRNLIFIKEKSGKSQGILKTDVCGNHFWSIYVQPIDDCNPNDPQGEVQIDG